MNNEKITINGVEYVPAGAVKAMAPEVDGLKYCIIRTHSAGVFAGYLKSRKGQEGTVLEARRLWHWKGAASLSQLAIDGVSRPDECKFPEAVPSVTLTQIVEVIEASEKAQESIKSVAIWKV